MDYSQALSISFSPIALILLCVAMLFAIGGIFIGLRPLWTAARRLPFPPRPVVDEEKEEALAARADGKLPKVSVIVYAPSRLEIIPEYLEQLLRQDYPDFEVIVVFSASAEATATLTEELAAAPNLTFTFIPPGSLNLSRRKLAITIGMKAAKGDVAIFTSSNCLIPSDSWISQMAAPFLDPATELALGFTRPDLTELTSGDKYYRIMDFTLTACSWIASAIAGRPFRGDASNMAIRRKTFFDHKGFANTISLHCGEDDLYVREIASEGNSAVVINSDTILTSTWASSADKAMKVHKAQADFTRYYLPQRPFLAAGFASMSQWGTLLCAAAGAIAGLPSLLPAFTALVILLGFWWLEIALYRKAAQRLQLIRLWWSLPFFMLFRPIGNFIFRLRHRSRRYANFTWNRHGSRK